MLMLFVKLHKFQASSYSLLQLKKLIIVINQLEKCALIIILIIEVISTLFPSLDIGHAGHTLQFTHLQLSPFSDEKNGYSYISNSHKISIKNI